MKGAPRMLLLAVVAVATVATGLFAYLLVRTLVAPPARTEASSGRADIGGPFTLVDGDGRQRSDGEFRGKLLLVYFGYTFCPDVCPTELQTMSEALDNLGGAAAGVQPLFITVDPERDTPAVMKAYVANFYPGLIGLTGSADEIAKAARAYRVYFRKNTSGSATDYLMDHSSIVYLMGRDGAYLAHFTASTQPADMAAAIRKRLDAPSS